MATNHYLRFDIETECACCGNVRKEPNELHMGKSSYGWRYLMRGHTKKDIHSLEEWIDFMKKVGGSIYDEYGCERSLEDWLGTVFIRHGVPNLHEGDDYINFDAYDLTYREFS